MASLRKAKINRDEWAMLVGRFILLFGDVENVTHLALVQLETLLGEEIKPHPRFANRVEQVVGLMKRVSQFEEDAVAEFVEKLKAAKMLSDTRNHVAHSPLMLTIYDHPKHGWKHQEIGLANARNRLKAMSLKDLQDSVREVERLSGSLYKLYAQLYEVDSGSGTR